MALNPGQQKVATLIYTLARQRGLPDARARELVAASIAESGLNPNAKNSSSGAGGLFQLLSPGYRQKAQQLGGVNDPRANTLAILPDYQAYWRTHPGAPAGAAAAAVERSGQGAGFYSRPLSQIGPLGAAQTPTGRALPAVPVQPGLTQQSVQNAPPDLRKAFANSLIAASQQRQPDYTSLFQTLAALHQSPDATKRPAAGLSLPMSAAPVPPHGHGKAVLRAGADRSGAHTSPRVIAFVSKISSLYGKPLTIGTGTNHSEHTVNGSTSDHWAGNAADIPATGAQLIRIGQAALVAAGMPPAEAAKHTSYAGTVNGHQIIFASNLPGWGDHRDHLHVSAH